MAFAKCRTVKLLDAPLHRRRCCRCVFLALRPELVGELLDVGITDRDSNGDKPLQDEPLL